MSRLKRWFNKLVKIIAKPEMRILPGNLALFLLMSIIPIFLLIGYVASLFGITMDTITSWMGDVLPDSVSNIIISFIQGSGIDGNIVMFMVMEFLIASNGADSLIITSNVLYKEDDDNFIKRRIKALVLTVLLIILIVIMVFVLAFGNNILKMILGMKIFASTGSYLYTTFTFLKWPIAFVLVFFIIKILYSSAPNGKVKSRTVNKGAFFASLGFILVTAFYSYYVSNFTRYDLFYAGLSNIAILMIWLYLLSYILVLGIAINANNHSMEKSTDNT